MTPLVDVSAFEEWLGVALEGDNALRALAILEAVSSLVRSEANQTWEDTEPPALVQGIVKEVARGLYNNPDSTRQLSLGDASKTYAVVMGLDLTPSQKRLLHRYRANQRGIWTLSTTRDDPAADSELYVPVSGTSALFPWYDS